MELEPPGIIPPDDDPVLGRDPVVEEVEDALDAGRLEEAVELAQQALERGEGNRLDLLFVCGDALLEMGLANEAEARFRAVLDEDAACPSSRCWLAMALYRQCRFEESRVECDRALAAEAAAIDAHVIDGLLLERAGRFQDADECFETAAELDPGRYPRPYRLSREEFDREVRKAVRRLPRQFRKHLDRLPVIVDDLPSDELLQSSGDLDPDLLGLFQGIPLPETSDLEAGELGVTAIHLFQRNLERLARDEEELVEQIHVTLYHELAHYLGFEEDDMDAMGLE